MSSMLSYSSLRVNERGSKGFNLNYGSVTGTKLGQWYDRIRKSTFRPNEAQEAMSLRLLIL